MATVGFEAAAKKGFTIAKLRRRVELAPATQELQETFALRRVLLKHGQRSEEECQSVRKFIGERTTLWREPFWALLTTKEQIKVAGCVKLRMVASDGEPHDCVAAHSTSGCMIFAALRGLAQVQCFDGTGTRFEFQPLETFGFMPVPDVLMEEAVGKVEAVKANPRSTVYRGEREYGERRDAVNDAGKIRVKIAPGGQYLSLSGADVTPLLQRQAKKHGRRVLMKSMGLELPGMHGAGGLGGQWEGNNRKREALMREARFGVGSILVEEGMLPTTVFIIVEGECRIVKGKAKSKASGAKLGGRCARYNLGSSQKSKVDMLLTSGFHTQVDVCHLGSLGEKALIGDIPALLGGVQPASIIAKTPLRVLQCRADKFAAHLDHNGRAKQVYVEAAKNRKARMEQRGAEVERLIALNGTPLLIDATPTNIASTGKHNLHTSNTNDDSHSGYATKIASSSGNDERGHDDDTKARDFTRTNNSGCHVSPNAHVEDKSGVRKGQGMEATPAPSAGRTPEGRRSKEHDHDKTKPTAQSSASRGDEPSNLSSTKTFVTCTPDKEEREIVKSTSDADARLPQSQVQEKEKLHIERVAATAGVPLLPCFSRIGSSLALARGAHSASASDVHTGAGTGKLATGSEPRGLSVSSSADELVKPIDISTKLGIDAFDRPLCNSGQQTSIAGIANGAERQTTAWPSRGGAGGVFHAAQRSPPTTASARTAVGASKDQAEVLLASHLTPFPTITKNRSLHAIAQPIVKHSAGFEDACKGENSQLGSAAWRIARSARHNGLVAPAEQLSIVRQIEAGFDALQGRRVSPVA